MKRLKKKEELADRSPLPAAHPQPYRRILLIQLGDIGDVILTLPAIKALRENFPESRLVVCVREKAREIIEDCPWASAVMTVRKEKKRLKAAILDQAHWMRELRSHRFDLAIDLRTGTRGAIIAALSGAGTRIGRFAADGRLWRNRVFTHLVTPPDEASQYAAEHNLNILRPLCLKGRDRALQITIPSHRKQTAIRLLSSEKIPMDRPILAFHPFSLWKYKEWQVNSCAELIDDVQLRYGVTVIITGSTEERGRADQVVARCRTQPFNLAGKTSIGELAAVLSACRGFIGVDTAALHLAAAVGIPTLGIFGPSPAVCWAPRGSRHTIVSKNMPCVPCRRKGCQNSEISQCLNELTLEDIHEELSRFIASAVT
ncbi:MAG: glycosyltransferase family 9 protein [Deltaproteobacteria bacterium]|nr:glycosyltransferase family 9 protein [Deltaproteobacteria bacterium]